MNKVSALSKLFRMVGNTKMSDFFANDFCTQARWKTAAKKNAFILIGKREFWNAAAFLILAGDLSAAINVILDKMKDYQLAIVVTKLYYMSKMVNPDGHLKELIKSKIFERIENDQEMSDRNKGHIKAILYWILGDYETSINCISGAKNNDYNNNNNSKHSTITSLIDEYILFKKMLNHPILIKFFKIEDTPKNLFTNYQNVLRQYQIKLAKIFIERNLFDVAEFLLEELQVEQEVEFEGAVEESEKVGLLENQTAENLFARSESPGLSEKSGSSLSLSFGSESEKEEKVEEETETQNSAQEPNLKTPQKTDHQKIFLNSLIKVRRPLSKILALAEPISPFEVPYFKNVLFDIIRTEKHNENVLLSYFYTNLLESDVNYLQHSFYLQLEKFENDGQQQISNINQNQPKINSLNFNYIKFCSKVLNSSFRKLLKKLSHLNLNKSNEVENTIDLKLSKNELKMLKYFQDSLISYDSVVLLNKLKVSAKGLDNIWPTETLARWVGDCSTSNSMGTSTNPSSYATPDTLASNPSTSPLNNQIPDQNSTTFRKIATKLYILVTSKILLNLLFGYGHGTFDQELTDNSEFTKNNLRKLADLIELFPNFKNFSKFFGGNIKLTKQNRSTGQKTVVERFIMPRVFLSDCFDLCRDESDKRQETMDKEKANDNNNDIEYFSTLCNELCSQKSLSYNLLKICILSLYLDKANKLLNRLNFLYPSIDLPITHQYLENLYSIRKILFTNLANSNNFPNFNQNSPFADAFHDKINQNISEKNQMNETNRSLFWQKNLQNLENCPFDEMGMVSRQARRIWPFLVGNEICREFLIYFLFRQEAETELEAKEKSDS